MPPWSKRGRAFQTMNAITTAVRIQLKTIRAASSDFLTVQTTKPPAIKTTSKTMTMPRTISPVGFISDFIPHDAFGMAGAAERGVVRNEALAVQIVEAVVHQDHALLATGL